MKNNLLEHLEVFALTKYYQRLFLCRIKSSGYDFLQRLLTQDIFFTFGINHPLGHGLTLVQSNSIILNTESNGKISGSRQIKNIVVNNFVHKMIGTSSLVYNNTRTYYPDKVNMAPMNRNSY